MRCGRAAALHELSEEDGLLYLIDCGLTPMAQVQWSWFAAREELIRYEDLLKHDEEILERVLLGHCRIAVDAAQFREVVRTNRFEAQSGPQAGHRGRPRPRTEGHRRRLAEPLHRQGSGEFKALLRLPAHRDRLREGIRLVGDSLLSQRKARVPRVPTFVGMGLAPLLVRNCTARVPSRKCHKGTTDHRGAFSPGISSVPLWWGAP